MNNKENRYRLIRKANLYFTSTLLVFGFIYAIVKSNYTINNPILFISMSLSLFISLLQSVYGLRIGYYIHQSQIASEPVSFKGKKAKQKQIIVIVIKVILLLLFILYIKSLK